MDGQVKNAGKHWHFGDVFYDVLHGGTGHVSLGRSLAPLHLTPRPAHAR